LQKPRSSLKSPRLQQVQHKVRVGTTSMYVYFYIDYIDVGDVGVFYVLPTTIKLIVAVLHFKDNIISTSSTCDFLILVTSSCYINPLVKSHADI
jgi:hypothetical protein